MEGVAERTVPSPALPLHVVTCHADCGGQRPTPTHGPSVCGLQAGARCEDSGSECVFAQRRTR